jgi:hypothetical protein
LPIPKNSPSALQAQIIGLQSPATSSKARKFSSIDHIPRFVFPFTRYHAFITSGLVERNGLMFIMNSPPHPHRRASKRHLWTVGSTTSSVAVDGFRPMNMHGGNVASQIRQSLNRNVAVSAKLVPGSASAEYSAPHCSVGGDF